jgi:hypothetical protein
MRHWVQYHNSEVRGPYVPSSSGFRIVTDKPVDSLRGDRVWLVTSRDNPRHYYLCATFIVDDVDRLPSGPQQNLAMGSSGQALDVRIDSMPWFPDLQHATGNFAFGLQHLKSPAIVAGLQEVCTSQ